MVTRGLIEMKFLFTALVWVVQQYVQEEIVLHVIWKRLCSCSISVMYVHVGENDFHYSYDLYRTLTLLGLFSVFHLVCLLSI